MTQPTQADINRLVKAAQASAKEVEEMFSLVQNDDAYKELSQALRPFQPDPDEEVIKQMNKAYQDAWDAHLTITGGKEVAMRAALAVVRKNKEVLG